MGGTSMWIMTTLLGTKNLAFRNARKVSTMATKPGKPTLLMPTQYVKAE